MSKTVVVTDRVARDLEAAYLWIAKEAPPAAARWYNGFHLRHTAGRDASPEELP